MTPTDQLRRIIQTCGMTRAELARLSGVAESVLSRFVNGETDMSMGNIDKLATVLKIDLVSRKRGKGR